MFDLSFKSIGIKFIISLYVLILGPSLAFGVDVVILTEPGGHESAASQVQKLFTDSGISSVLVYYGDLSSARPTQHQHDSYLGTFENDPEKLNARLDAMYALAEKAKTIREITHVRGRAEISVTTCFAEIFHNSSHHGIYFSLV